MNASQGRAAALKRRVFEIISPGRDGEGGFLSQLFDWTIICLILLSVVSIILESFAELRLRWHAVFSAIDTVTAVVFTVEYLLRIWTADLLYPDAKHPRLKYIFSAMALVDLAAILPFYLPFVSTDLRFLRMMRVSRVTKLLRVFKLGRYTTALQEICAVVKAEAPELVMSLGLCFFVVLFSSIVMYFAENPVQPESFPNVIASLWWAVCTITTVGYGDVYPITPAGRFFTAVISLVGIGIIAIPTGIIAAGFSRVVRRDGGEEEAGPEEDAEKTLPEEGARAGSAEKTLPEKGMQTGGAEKTLPEEGARAGSAEKNLPAELEGLEELGEAELLLIHGRVARRLGEYGYTAALTAAPPKESPDAPGSPELPS